MVTLTERAAFALPPAYFHLQTFLLSQVCLHEHLFWADKQTTQTKAHQQATADIVGPTAQYRDTLAAAELFL